MFILDEVQRKEALKLSASLRKATKMVMQGNFKAVRYVKQCLNILEPLDVEYVAIVNRAF